MSVCLFVSQPVILWDLEVVTHLKMEKNKIMMEIVATTLLPVYRLMANDCNAAACAKISHVYP